MMRNASITALGGYAPTNILTNEALTQMVDTSCEWIEKRTGIKERRIANQDESTVDLATKAIQNLLDTYEVNPSEIEMVVLATATPDHILTPSAVKVCQLAGLTNAFGIDLNAACSGFLYALNVASSMIESGRYGKVLVVGADKMSSIIDYTDRNTCVLFGDGAGAILLESSELSHGVKDSILRSDGAGAESLTVPAGGARKPADEDSIANRQHFLRQDGAFVFKNAVSSMSSVSQDTLLANGMTAEDIDWVVPHQANIRIIKAVSDTLEVPFEKFKVNIEKYGNTTSATIPLCLWDFKDDFKRGDNILLTSFGAGFTWGATCINWGVVREKRAMLVEKANDLLEPITID